MNPVYVRLMATRKVNMARLTSIENKQVIDAAIVYSRRKWNKTMYITVGPLPFGFIVVFANPHDLNKVLEEKRYTSVEQAQADLNPPAKQLSLFGR